MKRSSAGLLALSLIATPAFLTADGCTGKSKVVAGNAGSGGTQADGSAGTGGSAALAGTTGSAGSSGVGGTAGTGGAGGTAGSAGTPGVAGTGGAAGAAGSGGMGGAAGIGGASAGVQASVLEHHGNPSRDGVYIEPSFTKAAAAMVHLDPRFANAIVAGPTYAQPLYLAGAAGGPDVVIAATEQNHVYAFDAADGSLVWDHLLGTPVPLAKLPCGHIDPLGVTGTPIIDGATRTIYLDAMTTPDAGVTKKHLVFALDAATGNPRPGWPVDVGAVAQFNGLTFDSGLQNQRGALALLGGTLFVPFGGFAGDCGNFHGWVVGIAVSDPTQVRAWATGAGARGGGIWAPAGIASDGISLYFATGNTFNAATWQGGEAIFKMPPTLAFDGLATSYFVPANWQDLDTGDLDLGGTAPIVLHVPGATPPDLVVGIGKDAKAYLLDRRGLGGTAAPLGASAVGSAAILTASAGYTTRSGTYVVFSGNGSVCPPGPLGVTAFKIAAASPPSTSIAWCSGPGGPTAPVVTVTDASGSNPIVWMVFADYKLHALDGETGQTIFDGGAATDALPMVQKFQTPIVINGRIFVAASNQIFAFTMN